MEEVLSLRQAAWKKYKCDPLAVAGLVGVVFMILLAVLAPLISNQRPLLMFVEGEGWSMPFARALFAPDSAEVVVESVFNYFLLWLPFGLIAWFTRRRFPKFTKIMLILVSVGLLVPFIMVKSKLDKTDYLAMRGEAGRTMIFAPNPYGPFEQKAGVNEKPNARHWMGSDNIGRDITARMLYGARVSLAVGLAATAISLVIGTTVGICSGYFGGKFDLLVMRIVEIVICFPAFLLLLILMSMLRDYGFQQSILVVIAVIGFTDWIGFCRLVRGEALKVRALPYIASCEVAGMPVWRLMMFHLLPNVSGPILICFTFGIVGAILAESGLSFLGFGVQAPTASWGGLLRLALEDPFHYWQMTLFPGLALFLIVCAFNFTGEGLRKIFDPKKG